MLPKWHALLAFLFAYIAYWFTSITILQASLIFFSSLLIDADHYLWYILRKKDFSLKKAFAWQKKNLYAKKHKPIMMVFHTIEFLIIIGISSYFLKIFFFMFIGVLFHFILDVIDMSCNGNIRSRELILIRYLLTKDKDKYF